MYIPIVLSELLKIVIESSNLIFINNKNNPDTIVSAGVGLGNATINFIGFSIVYGLNQALDTLIS